MNLEGLIRFKGVPRFTEATGEFSNNGDYQLQLKGADGWIGVPLEPLTEEELNAAREAHNAEAQLVLPSETAPATVSPAEATAG